MPAPAFPRLSDHMLPLLRARVEQCQRDPALGEALKVQAQASFGIYWGREIFYAFLVAHLPPGEYLFMGTGPASTDLIAALQSPTSPLRITGFIERSPFSSGTFKGCPVMTAGEAAHRHSCGVIICHPALGETMAAELVDAGMDRKRIHNVIHLEGFQAFHDRMLAAEVVGTFLSRIRAERPRVDHVILVPNLDIWSVVEEDVLREALPPETTIRLYYGPPGKMDSSPYYPTFDTGQCLPLILRLLEALAPRSLYVRGSAQFKTEHLGAALKASLPHVFMTFEVYDYTGMLEDVFLKTWGYSSELVEVVRDAEAYLASHADFTLDKTPGAAWEAAAKDLFAAPRKSYAPTLGTHFEDPGAPPPRDPGPVRLLCAGSMPYFKNYQAGEGFPRWAYPNIVDPMVRLSVEADVHIDIFNASHDPLLDHWPAFGGYATLFDPARVGYHARIPVREVLARIATYDFGMFYFSASEVPIDYPLQQSLPNRCMTYIAGNLPLIVNTEMHCMAALVERFHAGITLPSTEMEDLPRRIREADLGTMKAGAVALKRHLVGLNAEALQAFKAALSEAQNRVR